MEETSQIKMQLLICVPEMVIDLVKDPIFCKFCVCALHSAYNFKNLCLSTEQHIQIYSSKVLHSKSIDIEDFLCDLQRSTRNSVCENNRECKSPMKEVIVTANMNLLFLNENLGDGQNLNTQTNICQRPVTLPKDALNNINNLNNITANDYCKSATQVTADELNSLLHDPLRDTPILSREFKQQCENEIENITIKEEEIDIPKMESSYAGFEDNLFEDAKTEDHTVKVMSIDEDPILQSNIETQSCFVKLKPLADDIVHKHNKFMCKICKFTTTTKRCLKTHELIHEENKYLSCASCNFHTVHRSLLIQHMETHTGEKPFACNMCTSRFAQKSGLRKHLRIHTGEKPFACHMCTFCSSDKSRLRNHLRTHTGEKPFACNVCTFRCSQKSSLQDHLRTHTGEKPFACTVCNFGFTQKSHLQRHLLIHTGEKPFACNLCTYRSSNRSTLKQHLRTHTGEKPFACNVCTYRSSDKSTLQNHLRIHTGEKPFACNVCTYRSTTSSNLQNHLRTHTGEKPFACTVCTYRCSQKSSLQRHLRTHTG